ncbi:kinesin-like protein KIF18A [Venturia canescens]|uniref:kinesin-like protein KIF18A n=1 Tax=Venturia canescens TaxID=32260 RepID=UPI001C9BC43E|nr:kinesin-like protein KIF18A [Venturia canescens]
MVFNKRDLEKAFSPNKARKTVKRLGNTPGGGSSLKPSTSGSTDRLRNDNGSAATSIRVIVRVRPPNDKESQKENHRSVIKVIDDKMLIFDPKEEESPFFYRGVAQKGRDLLKKQNKELEFMFDRVFDDRCSNAEVFEGTTKDIIASLLDGYNCSVFAYGATGAGKTHTMLGHDNDPGITFRTMSELFAQIEAQSENRDFNLGVTYLEVYNENVCDLLHKSGPLAIRDDGRHGIIVAGLKIITIYSPDELLTLLARGNKNRTQHPTDANEESSRSHAVFQVYVNITNKLDGQKKHVKLSMIDLAGSERASATGCKGARFKEGANINKSLLALGNCINNLADGIKHIPYRDSKLTRLLKDSLGGNCQTVMIANVGPSSLSFEDTYNTLRYANRAKKIKLNIKKNIISCQMHVTGYVKIVEEQKKEIEMLKQKLLALERRSIEGTVAGSPDSRATKDPKTEEMEKEFSEMRDKLIKLLRSKAQLNEKVLSLQGADKILCCRIQYKIAADKRLRHLTATVDAMSEEEQNASGKSRVNKSLSHFKRQREVVKLQMQTAWNDLQSIEMQIVALNATLVSKKYADRLIETNKVQQCEIEKIRYQQQFEHAKKVCSLQQCELQSLDTSTRTMSLTLQNYYNIMRGYGTMTDEMRQQFKQLVKSLEGVRNIKWAESEAGSYSPEDSYLLTCLSTDELDDPLNNEMPIYKAPYLEDEDTNQHNQQTKTSTILVNGGNTTTPPRDSNMDQTTPPPPLSLNSTITLDDEALLIKDSNDESTPSPTEITPETIKANQLNNTFNLMENKVAKKRTLADKNPIGNQTPVKQAKKISPKQRTAATGSNGVLTTTGKENKNNPPNSTTNKPASVMSAKSIAILNKLKADRLKLLPQPSNTSTESGTGDGLLCNKVVRIKERRGLVGTHPYQKTNAKPKSTSSVPSSRVPW